MLVPSKCKSSLTYIRAGKKKKRASRKAIDHYIANNPRWARDEFLRLAKKQGAPEDWTWAKHCKGKYRKFPTPWRKKSPYGKCVMCGRPIYKLGWHAPWGQDKKINKKANWHAVCSFVYLDSTRPKKKKGYQIDHFTPLYRVYRAWKDRDDAWPTITHFWSPDNIQYITEKEHKKKSKEESGERSRYIA